MLLYRLYLGTELHVKITFSQQKLVFRCFLKQNKKLYFDEEINNLVHFLLILSSRIVFKINLKISPQILRLENKNLHSFSPKFKPDQDAHETTGSVHTSIQEQIGSIFFILLNSVGCLKARLVVWKTLNQLVNKKRKEKSTTEWQTVQRFCW